jgi:hypothetical protein
MNQVPPPGVEKESLGEPLLSAAAGLPVGFSALPNDGGFTLSFRIRKDWHRGLWGLTTGYFALVLGHSLYQDLTRDHLEWPLVFSFSFAVLVAAFPCVWGLAYSLSGLFKTRAMVKVEKEGLTIVERPLPLRGKRVIPRSDLVQVYVQDWPRKDGISIYAITASNRQVLLADDIEDPAQAHYIEAEVERFLGIKDRRMSGELSKT